MASGALVPLMCIIHRSYVCQVRYFPGLSVYSDGGGTDRQGLSVVSFCCFCVLLDVYWRGKYSLAATFVAALVVRSFVVLNLAQKACSGPLSNRYSQEKQ